MNQELPSGNDASNRAEGNISKADRLSLSFLEAKGTDAALRKNLIEIRSCKVVSGEGAHRTSHR